MPAKLSQVFSSERLPARSLLAFLDKSASTLTLASAVRSPFFQQSPHFRTGGSQHLAGLFAVYCSSSSATLRPCASCLNRPAQQARLNHSRQGLLSLYLGNKSSSKLDVAAAELTASKAVFLASSNLQTLRRLLLAPLDACSTFRTQPAASRSTRAQCREACKALSQRSGNAATFPVTTRGRVGWPLRFNV